MDQNIIPFKKISLSSASDFISTIDELGSRAGYNKQLIWRGVGRSEYSLIPAAARAPQISLLEDISQLDTGSRIEITGHVKRDVEDAIYAAYREWCALIHFCRNANRQALTLPSWTPDYLHKSLTLATDESFLRSNLGRSVNAIASWPPGGIWPTLGLAQHYGIPTRLLDWSEDPMVAAYFAGTSAVNNALNPNAGRHATLSVWMLSATALGRIALLDDNSLGPKTEGSRGRLDLTIHVIDAPYSGNPNLAAQRGRFTLVVKRTGGIERRCLSEVMSEIDVKLCELPNYAIVIGTGAKSLMDHLIRIDLPAVAAPELLGILKRRSYDANRLFPGYGGAARTTIELTNAYRANKRINITK